jgi:very-short-patch-repair endonuclease
VSQLEALLLHHLKALKLEMPEAEYRFHEKRKWRFDFAYPDRQLAIEVEGGTYSNGRHTRAKGYEADCEKYNTAALQGWTVLRFTGDMIKRGEAVKMIERALA